MYRMISVVQRRAHARHASVLLTEPPFLSEAIFEVQLSDALSSLAIWDSSGQDVDIALRRLFPLIDLGLNSVIQFYFVARVVPLMDLVRPQQSLQVAKGRKLSERGCCLEALHGDAPNWIFRIEVSIVDTSYDLVAYAFDFPLAVLHPSVGIRSCLRP